jgi:hypothetical protein
MRESIANWAAQVRAPGREAGVPDACRFCMRWGGEAPRENKVARDFARHHRNLRKPATIETQP